jgi:hypothetical protein
MKKVYAGSVTFFIAFLFVTCLHADISIQTISAKKSITIDQQLDVVVSLKYPENTPPRLFSFFYNLLQNPEASFKVTSFSVGKPVTDNGTSELALSLILAPQHTGDLYFTPGLIQFGNQSYLVPGLKIDCVSALISNLPLGSLLPLYPERRIDLSPANRMALVNKGVLEKAKMDNEISFAKYKKAWNSLAWAILFSAVVALILWAVVYCKFLERSLHARADITPMQRVLLELNDPKHAGWPKLAEVLRVALGVKEKRDFQGVGLFELEGYVALSVVLTPAEKNALVPFIEHLGAITYAGKKATEQEYADMKNTLLNWLK